MHLVLEMLGNPLNMIHFFLTNFNFPNVLLTMNVIIKLIMRKTLIAKIQIRAVLKRSIFSLKSQIPEIIAKIIATIKLIVIVNLSFFLKKFGNNYPLFFLGFSTTNNTIISNATMPIIIPTIIPMFIPSVTSSPVIIISSTNAPSPLIVIV